MKLFFLQCKHCEYRVKANVPVLQFLIGDGKETDYLQRFPELKSMFEHLASKHENQSVTGLGDFKITTGTGIN